MKRIAVLTSGGDAPGMNSAIRAVTRTAIFQDMEIVGIRRGYCGLLEEDFIPMDVSYVADIIHRGGTKLLTARCDDFLKEENQDKAYRILCRHGIEGLVVIGGDGSFRGALTLKKRGLPVIGVPGTIDNDIAGTDASIGFSTAVNTSIWAIDHIRDTASSHQRNFLIEVMGRNSGHLALAAGLAGGAEAVLLPEIPFDLKEIADKIEMGHRRGKIHSIIVMAEGAGDAPEVANSIKEITGHEYKITTIGHIQRGGSPDFQDRLLASRLGNKAVALLKDGEDGKMVGICGEEIVTNALENIISVKKSLPLGDYALMKVLSI